MSTPALRQLGLGSLKRIYKLDVPELCSALQDAARRRISDNVVWDALLYRAALLRAELRPVDLALTVAALGKVRRQEADFMRYLMQEVRTKARRFLPRDTALLLNGFAKLSIRDELLTASLVPPLLRRLTEHTRWEDLALLSLAFARLGDRSRTPVFDRVVAAATPRIDRLDDGHALSLLVVAFTRPVSLVEHRAGGSPESLFAELAPQLAAGPGGDAGLPQLPPTSGDWEEDEDALPHLAFVEVLLTQCERNMWNFRSGDVLHLCLALSTLVRGGRQELLPPGLLKRIERRLESLYFEFLPVQFVRLLEVLAHLPELEKACAGKVLDEVAYRMRDVTPRSAMSVLRTVRRVGGHTRAHSAAAWRLAREDAGAALTASECCEVAEIFLGLQPRLWEAREAMLCLLQGMQKRRLEPDPALLARLLRAYGELGVRDTHWFHLCSKLSVCDLAGPTPFTPRSSSPPPSLDEQVVADALFALAQLNLPQLVDASALFSRASRCIASPEPAATALEAAALLSLVGRRPRELQRPGAALAPLVAAVLEGSGSEGSGGSLPSRLRLFPFCDLAPAACEPEVLLSWRRAAAQTHARAEAPDPLYMALGHELASWSGVEVVAGVRVGPLLVPWALNLVSLAEHLREHPLDGPSQVFPLSTHDYDEAGFEEEEEEDAPLDADQPVEEDEEERAPTRAGRMLGRRGRRAASPPSLSDADREAYGRARPDTHVLVLPLRAGDFFHASATLRGERQRAKTQLLGATRYAEVSLLKRLGWRVICVAEHLWAWGPEDDAQISLQNKELIFRLVAGLDDGRS